MEELRIKAKQLKEVKDFDKAIEIYSQIYSAESDNWLGWEYAYCLKNEGKIDEAIKICKYIYAKDKCFKHNNDLLAWLLFEKYFKILKEEYIYKDANQIFNIAIFISEIVAQDKTTPYEKIMLRTLKVLKKNLNSPDDKILDILEKLDSRKLSEVAPTYKNNDKETEYQSDKEMFYVYKTKALFNKKSYHSCIVCCDEALSTISKFHHSNDIWIESRKALCVGETESAEKAIDELEKLSAIKTHWIFFAEIAHLFQLKNDNQNALLYYCRAAITSDPPAMKVTLYYEIAMLINTLGNSHYAYLHALYAKEIRENEGWNIPTELRTLIYEMAKIEKEQDINIGVLQNFWIKTIHEAIGIQLGTITNVHQNGKFGFISNGKGSYYFKMTSSLGRYRAKQGDKVVFCLIESFDKTKNQKTKEAAYIKLDMDKVNMI